MIKALVQYTYGNDIGKLVLAHYNRSVWRKHDSMHISAKFTIYLHHIPGENSRVLVEPSCTKNLLILDHDKTGCYIHTKLKKDIYETCYGCSADGKWIISSLSLDHEHVIFRSINLDPQMKVMQMGCRIQCLIGNSHVLGTDIETGRELVVIDIRDGKELQRIVRPARYGEQFELFLHTCRSLRDRFHVFIINPQRGTSRVGCYYFNEESQHYEERACSCQRVGAIPLKYANFTDRSYSYPDLDPKLCILHYRRPGIEKSIVVGLNSSYIIAPVSKYIHSAVKLENGTVVTASTSTKKSQVCVRFYRPPASY